MIKTTIWCACSAWFELVAAHNQPRSHVISLAIFILCCVIYLFIYLSVGTPNTDRRSRVRRFELKAQIRAKEIECINICRKYLVHGCTDSMGTCDYTFIIINSLSQQQKKHTLQWNHMNVNEHVGCVITTSTTTTMTKRREKSTHTHTPQSDSETQDLNKNSTCFIFGR